MAKKTNEIRIIEIFGEITRFGDNFPTPQSFVNEDGGEISVLFFDVRSNGTIYKINVRGERALAAFQNGVFYHPLDEEWYAYPEFGLGNFVKITGSHIIKPSTDKFDRAQNVLMVWEPWNIRKCREQKRPAKAKMKSW